VSQHSLRPAFPRAFVLLHGGLAAAARTLSAALRRWCRSYDADWRLKQRDIALASCCGAFALLRRDLRGDLRAACWWPRSPLKHAFCSAAALDALLRRGLTLETARGGAGV